MFKSVEQRGINFLLWPELIGKGVFHAKSQSELLLKVIRLTNERLNITADHSLFRKLREGTLTDEDMQKYAQKYGMVNNVESLPNTEFGAWCFFKNFFDNEIPLFQSSDLPLILKKANIRVFSFFSELCDVDRAFISAWRNCDPKVNSVFLQKAYCNWLLVDADLNREEGELKAELAVAAVLNLAAMFHLYMSQTILDEEGESSFHSFLPDVLPKVIPGAEHSTFVGSNHLLVEVFKSAWEKSPFRIEKRATWQSFYKDLHRAEVLPVEWYYKDKNDIPLDLINPDVSKIKKRLKRMKDGYRAKGQLKPYMISSEEARLFVKSYAPALSEIINQSLLEVNVVSIFEIIQTELLNLRFHPQKICKLFERYPQYQAAVQRRFEEFCATGRVAHQFDDLQLEKFKEC